VCDQLNALRTQSQADRDALQLVRDQLQAAEKQVAALTVKVDWQSADIQQLTKEKEEMLKELATTRCQTIKKALGRESDVSAKMFNPAHKEESAPLVDLVTAAVESAVKKVFFDELKTNKEEERKAIAALDPSNPSGERLVGGVSLTQHEQSSPLVALVSTAIKRVMYQQLNPNDQDSPNHIEALVGTGLQKKLQRGALDRDIEYAQDEGIDMVTHLLKCVVHDVLASDFGENRKKLAEATTNGGDDDDDTPDAEQDKRDPCRTPERVV
jgi:hypothetical protein